MASVAAADLVNEELRRFPWPADPGRRYSMDYPYLAVVNARGPWAVWRHESANPPFIPLSLDLFRKEFWRAASDGQRVFALTVWARAAEEDDWGIIWGDPVRMVRQWRLERTTLQAHLDWMIARGLAVYLSEEEADAVRGWQPPRRGRTGSRSPRETKDKHASKQASKQEQEQEQEQGARSPAGGTAVTEDPARALAEQRKQERESRERGASGPDQARAEQSPEPNQSRPEESETIPTVVPGSVRILANPLPPPGLSAAPPFPPVSDGMRGEAPGGLFPGRSPPSGPGDPRSLGDCLPAWAKALADPRRDGWVLAVFGGLGFKFPPESPAGRQECGALAALYDRLFQEPVASALTEAERDLILAHDVKTAREKGRWRGNKRPGAVLTKVHYDRLFKCLERKGRDDIIRQVQARRRQERQQRQEKTDWWNH
jgi:hypothetical protein